MMHRSRQSPALAYPMLSGESIMSESQERSAALRELIASWRESADFAEKHLDWNIRNNNVSDDDHIEVYRSCASELEALIEREAAASLSPRQPSAEDGLFLDPATRELRQRDGETIRTMARATCADGYVELTRLLLTAALAPPQPKEPR
jgi:hypothetical protein